MHTMEAEDFATAGIKFASGAAGSIMATTATIAGGSESITLDGTRASATLEDGQLTLTYQNGSTETFGELASAGGGADPMAFSCEAHRDLIRDFALSILEARAPRITAREGLRVHALIEAIVASSREGRRLPVQSAEPTKAFL
ncbi:Gfo/Idh/MocA family oxidoreductase [Pseudovibrio sp. Tun.PSC04-5.I4]|uniref:Gfo/Idh/MocA family oxidoreductase n=1 Tax=Pseudovibrio sp. Tun.PSC04-5.I4 TaxID=1798213 RepID=UPI000B857883